MTKAFDKLIELSARRLTQPLIFPIVIPERLPFKLKVTREKLGLSLGAMTTRLEQNLRDLGYAETRLYTGNVLEFERGVREPVLPILVAYSRLANVYVDVLLLKDFDLPNELPSKHKSAGVQCE